MSVSLSDLDALAQMQDKIDAIEKEMKPLKERVKSAMLAEGKTNISYGGHEFLITESNRTTCKDKTGFVAALASLGLKDIIDTTIEANYQRARDAISTGRLSQQVYDAYVKDTPSKSFKIK